MEGGQVHDEKTDSEALDLHFWLLSRIKKDGLKSSYFLLGDDFYLQNFLKKYIKNKFGNDSIVKHLDLNESLDLDYLLNEILS